MVWIRFERVSVAGHLIHLGLKPTGLGLCHPVTIKNVDSKIFQQLLFLASHPEK